MTFRRAAMVVTGPVLLAGCTSTVAPPVYDLVPARPDMFYGVAVVAGSSGPELLPQRTLWWITAPAAEVRVSNTADRDASIRWRATLMLPPCSRRVVVDLTAVNAKASVPVGTIGAQASLLLAVPAHGASVIKLAVRGSGCLAPPDPRQLYVGLAEMSTEPISG